MEQIQWWGFDLDENFEQLWHELEEHQDGDRGHHIAFKAPSKSEASKIIGERLRDFFERGLYPSNKHGEVIG